MAQQLLAATGRGWARVQVWFNAAWMLLFASLLMCTSANAQVIFSNPAISATSGTAGPDGTFVVTFSGTARASIYSNAVNEIVVVEGSTVLNSVTYPVSYNPKTEAPINSTVTIRNSVALTPGTHTLRLVAYTEVAGDLATQDFVVTVASATPVNGATFVSQSVPASMYAGQPYTVSVTMKNTGTKTRTPGGTQPHVLGSQNPGDNTTWGFGRVALPASVAPGATATFSFTVTAPASPGTYNFQWGMLQEAVEWFGGLSANVPVSVTTAPPINNAAFVSQSVPSSMTAGQAYTVSVTMKNTGNTTWTVGGTQPFGLGSQNPQDNTLWRANRVAVSSAIAPGAAATFSFSVTAPSTPGTYNFQWQMVQDFVGWFGPLTTNAPVTVTEALPTVTLTSPANGTRFTTTTTTATVALTGSAAGTAGATIARLEFFDGATSLGYVASTSISLSKALAVGSHTIELRATDSRGKTRSAFSTITVAGPPPAVTLTAPVTNGTYAITSGSTVNVQVTGSVSSASTIAKLEVLDGTTPIHTTSGTAVNVALALAAGQHALQLRATDSTGQVGTSAVSNINVFAATAGDAAGFVSQTMPTALRAGQPVTFSVSMVNTGTSTWSEGASFRLGSQNPQDNRVWGGRVYLTGSVAPGQTGTFTATVTAPQTAGTYNFQWQMVHEYVTWFGAKTDNLSVSVAAAAGPTATLTGTPTNVRVSGTGTAAVTLTGNGSRSGGVVSKLELFQANATGMYAAAPVKSVTGSTATLTMSAPVNLAAGIHFFKLRSTDSAGLQTESRPVIVNVTNSALLGTIGGVRTNAAGTAELYGWTCQSGSATPLNYKVLLDAPSLESGGTELTTGVANVATELDNASVQSQCATPGTAHHFVVNLSTYIAQYAGRRLYVWAETANKALNVSLPCADNNCTMPGTTRVGITTPTANATYVYPNPAFLKMKLTNYSGTFDEVGFYVNGQWIAAQPDGAAGEYSVQKTGLAISTTPYTVYAVARQGGTAIQSAVVPFYVSAATSVTLTAPQTGATATVGTPLAMAATVSTVPNGVAFFANGTLVATGVNNGGTWIASWTPAQAGTATVFARALDGAGGRIADSATATVTVKAGTGSSALPLPVNVTPPHLGNADAGTLPGELTVEKDGAAHYSVALPVPPGSGGLQPALVLNYSSAGGNGMLGLGWSMSGLSQIHRCAKTVAQDGIAGRVAFNSADRLCLDGERLLRVDGTNPGTDQATRDSHYWGSGASYRTEEESFARITRLANGGFKVEDKQGLIHYYGIDTASAVPAQGRGDGQPLLWALARTEDRSTNYMVFDYNYNSSTGEFTPKQIRYGGNAAASQSPFLTVRFGYDGSRTDAQTLYMGGARSDLRSLLTSIATYTDTAADGSGGNLVRQHQMGYVASASTGRSLMQWMQASATHPETGMLQALPRTEFAAGAGGAPAFADTGMTPFTLPMIGRTDPARLQGDLDGSGRTSFIAAKVIPCGQPGEVMCFVLPNFIDGMFTGELRIRLPDGRIVDRTLSVAAMGLPTGTHGGIMSYQVGDVNGDGRDDIIALDPKSTRWGVCYTVPAADGTIDFNCTPGGSGRPTMVDLRNDRRMHMLSRFDTSGYGQDCYLEGGAVRCATVHLSELPPLPAVQGNLREVDFFKVAGINLSQDGMTDLYSSWESYVPAANPANPFLQQCVDGKCSGVDVVRGVTACFNGQTDFNCRALYQSRSVGKSAVRIDSGNSIGDLNGDGLSDFAYGLSDAGSASGFYLCLSMETGIDCRAERGFDAYIDPQYPQNYAIFDRARIGDFTGDGINRILVSRFPRNRWPTDPSVITADALLCRGGASGYACDSIGYSSSVDYVGDPIFLDGSGIPAFLIRTGAKIDDQPSYRAVTLKADPSNDRMIRVTNGLGHVTEVDYGRAGDPALYRRFALVDGAEVRPVYPQVAVAPGPMVKQLRISNDKGGWVTHVYRFAGAMNDASGRGGAGFTTMEEVDGTTGNTTVTTYAQRFPFLGRIERTVTTSPSGIVLSDTRIRHVAQTIGQPSGADTVLAVMQQRDDQIADTDGSAVGTVTVVNTYNDGWGNLTGSTLTRAGGGKTYVTASTIGYQNDSVNWLIGLPRSSVVSHSAPDTALVTRTTTQQYDSAGRLWKEVEEPDTPLQVLTTYERSRNQFGLVDRQTVEWTDPASATLKSRTEHDTGYDTKGRFAERVTNALRHVEGFTYYAGTGQQRTRTDANGLTTRWTADGFGRIATSTEPNGNQTRLYWKQCAGTCPLGAAMVRVEERFNGSDRIATPVVRYEDASGRQLRALSWSFAGTETWSDARYDEKGRLAEVDQPRFANAASYLAQRVRYDTLNRMDRITSLDESNRELYVTVEYKGLLRIVTNRKNQRREERRNMLGLVDQVTDPLRGVTAFAYNGAGDLVKTVDPNGNVITVDYDRRGRRTDLRDPDRGWTHYDVDPLGRVWKQTTPNQRPAGSTRFEYDALDRTTGRYESRLESHWVYDTAQYGVGKLARAFTSTGLAQDDYSRVQGYDALGRLATTSTKLSDATYTQSTQYDAWGRPIRKSYQRGASASKDFDLRYNANGYPSTVERGPLVLWRVTAADAAQRATGVALGNGLAQQLTYDPYTGRLSEDNVTAPGAARRLQQGYAYDALGNVKQRTQYWESAGFTELFDYDDLNRLTSSQVAGQTQQVFGYNNLGGNLSSKSGAGTYTYPAQGANAVRPHAVQAISGLTGAFEYDLNGNLLRGAGKELTWFEFDKPVTIAKNGITSTFVYGPEHQRVRQQRSGLTIVYGGAQESETRADGVTVKTYWPGGIGVEIDRPNGTTELLWTHTDRLGSIVALTDQAGVIKERMAYDAWGKRRTLDGSGTPDNLDGQVDSSGFTGHEMLDAQDMVHMNGRVYDPLTGRFASPDPHLQAPSDGQSYNRYSYALNNPTNLVDPSGYDAIVNVTGTRLSSGLEMYGMMQGMQLSGVMQERINTAAPMPTVTITGTRPADKRPSAAAIYRSQAAVARELSQAKLHWFLALVSDPRPGFAAQAEELERLALVSEGDPQAIAVTAVVYVVAPLAGARSMRMANRPRVETNRWSGKVDYSSIPNPPNVGAGKDFTLRQKQEALRLNRAANGGVVKSDASGTELVQPQKSQRGVTPDPNEWQFDHIDAKNCGGTNCSSNLQILSRHENREKSDN